VKLSKFVENYTDELPTGIVLSEEQITRTLIKSVRFYGGYACFTHADDDDDEIHSLLTEEIDLDGAKCLDLFLTLSEWSIIRPLFDAYIELENATALEATRGQGLEVYGRNTSEIQQEITLLEQDMPKKAFVEPYFTV